jgi:hypothetical protein
MRPMNTKINAPLKKTYQLQAYSIDVSFEPKLISIETPHQLKQLLAIDTNMRSAELAQLIKNDYLNFFSVPLRISNRSMVIEIWAHLFASYIANAILNNFRLRPMRRFATFMLSRSDKIDCGEKHIDSNRIVWDLLSPFKFLLLPFI